MGGGLENAPLSLHWCKCPGLARAIEWSIGLRGHVSSGRTTWLPAGVPDDVMRRIAYLAAHGFLRIGTESPGLDTRRTITRYLDACAAVGRLRKALEASPPGSYRHKAEMERLAALKKARAALHKAIFGSAQRKSGYRLDD